MFSPLHDELSDIVAEVHSDLRDSADKICAHHAIEESSRNEPFMMASCHPEGKVDAHALRPDLSPEDLLLIKDEDEDVFGMPEAFFRSAVRTPYPPLDLAVLLHRITFVLIF